MNQIGRYEIVGELGKGGMGIVYEALDRRLGRTIALKIIRLDALGTDDEREESYNRLYREARSAGALSHPGIVVVFDAEETEGVRYIAMEYVKGPTLEHLIAGTTPLKREEIISVVKQTAEALDHAHAGGVIHRDIKPSNILLQSGKLVKITDFGIAKLSTTTRQLTQPGIMMGTPSYMSPEEIQGLPLNGRADQFSLAVMAFEILTGKRPFHADSQAALIYQIVQVDRPSARSVIPTLPEDVDEVFQRGLAKRPEDRYPSCSGFAEALEAALSPSAVGSSGEQRVERLRGKNLVQARRTTILVSAGLVALIGTGLAVKYTGRKEARRPIAATVIQPAQNLHPRQQEPTTSLNSAPQEKLPTEILPPEVDRSVTPRLSTRYTQRDSRPGGNATRASRVIVTTRPDKPPTAMASVEPPPSPPTIDRFFASQSAIQSGQAMVLKWEIHGADAISILGVGSMLPAQGTSQVCPTDSKAYTLEVRGPGGHASRSVNIDVQIPPGKNPKLKEFRVAPPTITLGEPVELRWGVEYASFVWIDPDIGQVDACGVLTVHPRSTTKYQLSYRNDRGTLHSKPVEITVTGNP